MEEKKSAKANLEKNKQISLLMGMVVAIAIVFVSFEWGTRNVEIIKYAGAPDIFTETEIDITLPEVAPPPPPPPPVSVAEQINIMDDDDEREQTHVDTSEDFQEKIQDYIYTNPVPEIDDIEEPIDIPFVVVEDMPEFPGGQVELMKWISRTIKYPASAQDRSIQGRVTCSFIINKDGSVVEAEIVRGIDPTLDREALRVIGQMPKWTPGKQRGKEVRVKYTMPIVFRLQ